MTTIFKVFLWGLVLSLVTVCSDGSNGEQPSSLDAPKLVQWYLPKQLREVSGLALVSDNEVLAIQDERATVFRLDIQTGEVIDRFNLGKPAVKGDFEGVAVQGQRIYLLTSNGRLYKSTLTFNGNSHPYEKFDLGLSEDCELEGLAHEPNTELLWMVCKQIHKQPEAGRLRLHAWSTASKALKPELTRQLPVARDGQVGKLNPSGLAFTPSGERLLVIAARQASYAWYAWSSSPELTSLEKLPARGKHRQAEGVAITGEGMLLIADEGKKRSGTLSLYSALLK